MELNNRDELEAEFALKVSRLTAKRRKELEELLGNPPDITKVPEQFWIDAEADLRRETLLMLLLISSASYRQHGGKMVPPQETPRFDQAMEKFLGLDTARESPPSPLIQWAADNANKTAELWREHSEKWLRKSADDWESNPDSVTDDEIRDTTLKIFGPSRAARIAIDETTRAQYQGGEYAVSNTVGLSDEDIWRTRTDERVCPICTPLDGTKRSYWRRFFPGGPPDPHIGCRCYVIYQHEQELAGIPESLAESFKEEDHPRDEHGRFSPGTGATEKHVSHAEQSLRKRLEKILNEPNVSKSTRQYLGQVKDFWFAGELPPEVSAAHVFYDPAHKSSAAVTEGKTITLGDGAFSNEGSSLSLGDTFVHELEHLHDVASGIKRTEFSPRYRQMMREIVREPPLTFINRHSGRENAESHVRSFFATHPGHELNDDEVRISAIAIAANAKKRLQASMANQEKGGK